MNSQGMLKIFKIVRQEKEWNYNLWFNIEVKMNVNVVIQCFIKFDN